MAAALIGGKVNIVGSMQACEEFLKMTNVQQSSPHVYYSVSELSMVKDVTVMKNTKIKTVGYVYAKDRRILKESAYSSEYVLLDLRHIEEDILEIHPYLLFGVLCTINGEPVVTVKSIKKIELSSADLESFKKQCVLLRNRGKYVDNIIKIAEIYNWS